MVVCINNHLRKSSNANVFLISCDEVLHKVESKIKCSTHIGITMSDQYQELTSSQLLEWFAVMLAF
jgi:hypothetical protein